MRRLTKKRFKAFLIDITILSVLGISILVILMINVNKSFLFIFGLTTAGIYGLFFCKDVINGQSIGKKILKLQIVTENGKAANLWNIILRNIIALLQPIDAFYMINNKGKRLGDIICKTRVVNATRKIKYESNLLLLVVYVIAAFFIAFSFFFVIWIIVRSM